MRVLQAAKLEFQLELAEKAAGAAEHEVPHVPQVLDLQGVAAELDIQAVTEDLREEWKAKVDALELEVCACGSSCTKC